MTDYKIYLLFYLIRKKCRYNEYSGCSIEKKKNKKSSSKIDFPIIKKIIQSVLGPTTTVNQTVLLIMHTIAKVHAGELVEEARIVMEEENELYGTKLKTIQPKHLREAHRRMDLKGIIPSYSSS